jgi:hypothetical protein
MTKAEERAAIADLRAALLTAREKTIALVMRYHQVGQDRAADAAMTIVGQIAQAHNIALDFPMVEEPEE